MENGITPVMNMGSDTGFSGGGMWIFALLILLLLGNGGGLFGGNYSRAATVEDLNNSANFTRLENQVMNTANLVERKADAITNGICDLGYKTQADFNALNQSLSSQISALSSKIDQNKIESLQAQVSELKTQNMFCGIPRINPYGYQVVPTQYNCGCNGQGYNI